MKYIFTILLLFSTLILKSQDTLSGTYNTLTLTKGFHFIKEVIKVKNDLVIEPGAKIELQGIGRIICESGVKAIGKDLDIEIYGNKLDPGIGLVINNIDSTSIINLSNIIFKNLQLPLVFDYGWIRKSVEINNNQFVDNIGRVSLIQVLNQRFINNFSYTYIPFKISKNLFTGNNAPIYFEDFKSDNVDFYFYENSIVNNRIYGFKNYNISTNFIYGRQDQVSTRFSLKIINNSFVSNYFVDNISDSVLHNANIGIYGTDNLLYARSNYWGTDNIAEAYYTIYDQTLNYDVPKIEISPILKLPKTTNPTHVYKIKNQYQVDIQDTVKINQNLGNITLISNNKLLTDKIIITKTSFLNDSSLDINIDTLSFTIQNVNNNYLFFIKENFTDTSKKIRFYSIDNIYSIYNSYVPNIKIGNISFQYEMKKRKLNIEFKSALSQNETTNILKNFIDSSYVTYNKLDKTKKHKIEITLNSLNSIFLGTISSSNIFLNDINNSISVGINYQINTKFGFNLNFSKFKISNSDYNSDNNDQISRGMSFSTQILSLSPSFEYNFINLRSSSNKKLITSTIGAGLDIFSFDPMGTYKGIAYHLQPLGTGGQFLTNNSKSYSLLSQALFFDFKLTYNIPKYFSIGLFLSYHLSFTNYLDDVGEDVYPDRLKLFNSTKVNNEAAIYFSNPSSQNVLVGQLRNSPNNASDKFILFGFSLSKTILK